MFELPDRAESARHGVRIQWDLKIPMRDGVHLSATLYLPNQNPSPSPALVTLTPYVAQTWHEFAHHFAAHGYPFLAVDLRGRGNSEGQFQPFVDEVRDGYDVVEWLAQQHYCNGKVAMWGGSYAAFSQWATAREKPPHLETIVPAAAAYIGVDMPIQCNILAPYLMQWLTLVYGRTLQDRLFFNNERFWGQQFRAHFESGRAFRELDGFLGNPSPIFQEWVAHPHQCEYYDRCNPSGEQYARMDMPILTITGHCDSDQPGALMHYREHLRHATPEAQSRHFLLIGPWDHLGTRAPAKEFCGLTVGAEALIDLPQLHREWYAWTMSGGPRPSFLKKNVVYYVMVADTWRYADTLEEVTARSEPLYLAAKDNPIDLFHSGELREQPADASGPDHFVYDPRDVSLAGIEATVDPESRADQRMIYAAVGKQLIYHSAPFSRAFEISGFFKLHTWIAIDQADTDLRASIYDVNLDGSVMLLSTDSIRARYRESLREAQLIQSRDPLLYRFERFTFVSRLLRKGNRLRLVIGPINSVYSEKNYGAGGVVASESVESARCVNIRVFHDASRPSALYLPHGLNPDLPHPLDSDVR